MVVVEGEWEGGGVFPSLSLYETAWAAQRLQGSTGCPGSSRVTTEQGGLWSSACNLVTGRWSAATWGEEVG